MEDELRRSRDGAAVEQCLDELESVARADGNVVDAIFAAVKAEATLGEVADRMREVFGEHRETGVY